MIEYPTRAQVFHGKGLETSGRLRKADLFRDRDGRIKSKAAVAAAKKRVKEEATAAAKKRMKEEGKISMIHVFKAKKGTFKLQPKKGTAAYKKLIKKM
jgi:hypothetical protein